MERLLLEIGAEEIPAGYIAPALAAMASMLKDKLTAARIDHGEMATYGTPRRLAVVVDDVAPKQHALSTEVLGPPAKVGLDASGNPTVAGEKFAEKLGVPVSRLKVKETKKGDYLCARKSERGLATRTILKQILPDVVLSVPFPKSMRWADLDISFARPIHSVVALYGNKVVSFAIGNVKSNRYSRGHYFMNPGRVKLADPGDYIDALEQADVVADIEKRKVMVDQGVREAAGEAGGRVREDEDLLDTVTNLVEFPVATAGNFEAEFLEIPGEILITAMREHQKYFAVTDDAGALKNSFVAVNNTRTKDLALVATGHERVLRARLSDAQFFYRSDLAISAEERMEKLDGVLFQAKLGSMSRKTDRIVRTAAFLAERAGGDADAKAAAERAAWLCKTDLVSHVVVEFPKLQGVMGRVYASVSGESEAVAVAIEEHYRPTRSGGRLPETLTGALVSIADKIDSICGCFSIGLVPTGAADPYALRRQGIGIIQIMQHQGFDFSLQALIDFALNPFADQATTPADETAKAIYVFLKRRISGMLVEEGFSKDVVAAVADVSIDRVPDVWKRVRALQSLKTAPDFEPLAAAFKRVANIMKKADVNPDVTVDPSLFEDESESALYQACQGVEAKIARSLGQGEFDQALRHIATLRDLVDRFFEGVMVMADDGALRGNRLALLGRVAALFEGFADFSKLTT
jgi:glycyl-tRNA synthetase beta chain